MKPLLEKLEKIKRETFSSNQLNEYELDDFTRMRKKIWEGIKEIRQVKKNDMNSMDH